MRCAFDDFTTVFAQFMVSGDIGRLAEFCEPGASIERLKIYRNGYLKSVMDVLASNYPTVHALLDEALFRRLCRQFISRYPPKFGSLVGYGHEFVAFLGETVVGRQTAYLVDVAALDRAWLQVYFSADTEPLTPGSVTEMICTNDVTGLQAITLVPAAMLVRLHYPITAIWQTLKDCGRPDQMIDLQPDEQLTLLWRAGAMVVIRVLPAAEQIFFESLIAGMTLEIAAEKVINQYPEFDLNTFFSQLITAGLLSGSTKQTPSVQFQ